MPYLESVVLAAGALARFGSEELQQGWGVPAVSGEKILTVALDGEMGEGPVQAARAGDGYRLTGTRTQVGYGPVADALPGSGRNRFRHSRFPGRRRATRGSR